jgi:hypothetical protein
VPSFSFSPPSILPFCCRRRRRRFLPLVLLCHILSFAFGCLHLGLVFNNKRDETYSDPAFKKKNNA